MARPDPLRQPRDAPFHAATALWGFAEATLFFIVPDVLLTYVGLTRGPKSAAAASLFAAAGAAVGAVPAIGEAMAAAADNAVEAHGWFAATMLGPLTSTPYKLYAVLAPHAGAPLALFALASIAARLLRFLIVGVAVALIGRWLEPRLGRQALLWVLAIAWIAFYAAFFALVPGCRLSWRERGRGRGEIVERNAAETPSPGGRGGRG